VSGLYQAAAPPAVGGTYQTSAPPATGAFPAAGTPRYSDLVTMPGEHAPETPAIDGDVPVTPEPPVRSRRGLLIGLAIVAAVFLLAVAGTAIVVKVSNLGTSYAVNSCVRQDGEGAKGVSCSDKDAFRIVSKVDAPTGCSDASQPFITLQKKGQKDQVLCLRPANQK
jgi:hypothetical protein